MPRTPCLAAVALALATSPFVHAAPAPASFDGWQALRVVEQEGRPWRMRCFDLDGDGDDEVVVVNLRNARLDLYTWRDTPADPEPGTATPNELPMAPELERTEVGLRQSPIDAAPADLDHDGVGEIYVLVGDPNRIIRLRVSGDDGKWTPDHTWELLPGGYAGAGELLKIIPGATADDAEAIVSTNDGLQRITLNETGRDAGRAAWFEPRESRGRNDWWLMDLDADGDDDLVEWTSEASETLRWWPRAQDGTLKPAQPLHDRPAAGVVPLGRELLVLEQSPSGLVRRYHLSAGEEDALGKRELLPLAGGADAVWALDPGHDVPVLVAVDQDTPRLLTFAHHPERGWSAGPDYATLGKLKAVAAAPAGGLLLWPADGADLYLTRYEDGRYAYPTPLNLGVADEAGNDETSEPSEKVEKAQKAEKADAPERKILGLGTANGIVWSVQRVGDDLVLHRWDADHPVPVPTRFPDAAGKADAAHWIGTAGLLVADKFARGLRHVTLADGTATSTSPARLAKASLDDYRLVPIPQSDDQPAALRLARLSEGVLQWLDDDLIPREQVMLPDGRGLADLVMTSPTSGFALQSGGNALHTLETDDAGVLRVVTTRRIRDGRALHLDPALGLLLTTGRGVERLSQGAPLELEVVQAIDARDGRPASPRDATVHRITALDLTGDGQDEAILADDLNHELIALSRDNDASDYAPLVAWKTFENQAYPYGGGGQEATSEPRDIATLDLDGDGQRDLVMLTQDRIVFYLAGKPNPDTEP